MVRNTAIIMKLLKNGKIYCGNNCFCENVVIDEGRIIFTGSNEDIKALYADKAFSEIIDLEGRTVLPGFADSHAHGTWDKSDYDDKFDLSESESIEEYKSIIREYVEKHPEKDFYKGTGWASPLFGEDGPDKSILDEICPDKPVAIQAREGHAIWANSRLIEMAGIKDDTPEPRGGNLFRNADGSARGCFADEAQELLNPYIPDYSIEYYKSAIINYQKLFAGYGVSMCGDMMIKKGSNTHKAYEQLADEDRLLQKTVLHYHISPMTYRDEIAALGPAEKHNKGRLFTDSFVKFFTDGALENHTAVLLEDYSNEPGFRGELLWNDDDLTDAFIQVDRLGYDIHIHCIGDGAIKQAVDSFEAMCLANGDRDRKFVIAHVQLATEREMDRMAKDGIMVSANPYWFFRDAIYTEENEIPSLGKRVDLQYPMKSLMDRGIIVSGGTDHPISYIPDPVIAIKTGMQRVFYDCKGNDQETMLGPDERVSFEQMLECMTINGAITLGIENIAGSLESGKAADLAVLNKDIFITDPDDFGDIRIDLLICDGEVIYDRTTEE